MGSLPIVKNLENGHFGLFLASCILPNEIWNFWEDDNVVKSTLSVHQQGAGNGKTYSIWKSITENTDRKTYIIVTKQHSAKTVIYEELNDQKKRLIQSNR